MRIAIVHDWFAAYAGAERILEELLRLYPDADLYALFDVLPADQRAFLRGRTVRTSFMQRLPFIRRHYAKYLPLMPLAIEQFDLGAYDLVISSSWSVAKGVLTGPDQVHVCLCYSPMRYAWDLHHQYLSHAREGRGIGGLVARLALHRIRTWDVRTSNGVDAFCAISGFIAGRIWKTYRRESAVIYPPVDISRFSPGGTREDFYVTASRLVAYKRVDLVVEAFRAMPARKLVVVGDGPMRKDIERDLPANVTMAGWHDADGVRDWLRRGRAFLFAAEEDFGIAPLEAQACGTPVIALGRGGAVETIRGLDHASPSGVHFPEPTAAAIVAAVGAYEAAEPRITAANCRANAERFAPERWHREFAAFVDTEMQDFQSRRNAWRAQGESRP